MLFILFSPLQVLSQQNSKIDRETIQIWDEYNGKSLGEETLKAFLLSQNNKELIKFYEFACSKGQPNFCHLGGMFFAKTNKSLSVKLHQKGCSLKNDTASCMQAVIGLIDLKSMKEAANIYKNICNSENIHCDINVRKEMPKSNEFKDMLKIACADKHEHSCRLFEKYK